MEAFSHLERAYSGDDIFLPVARRIALALPANGDNEATPFESLFAARDALFGPILVRFSPRGW